MLPKPRVRPWHNGVRAPRGGKVAKKAPWFPYERNVPSLGGREKTVKVLEGRLLQEDLRADLSNEKGEFKSARTERRRLGGRSAHIDDSQDFRAWRLVLGTCSARANSPPYREMSLEFRGRSCHCVGRRLGRLEDVKHCYPFYAKLSLYYKRYESTVKLLLLLKLTAG